MSNWKLLHEHRKLAAAVRTELKDVIVGCERLFLRGLVDLAYQLEHLPKITTAVLEAVIHFPSQRTFILRSLTTF